MNPVICCHMVRLVKFTSPIQYLFPNLTCEKKKKLHNQDSNAINRLCSLSVTLCFGHYNNGFPCTLKPSRSSSSPKWSSFLVLNETSRFVFSPSLVSPLSGTYIVTHAIRNSPAPLYSPSGMPINHIRLTDADNILGGS